MSTRVKLPPGCVGFRKASDNSVIDGKSGGTITLEGPDEKSMLKSQNRSIGLVTPETHTIGTKKGRYCVPCSRLWQAWSEVCPKCGAETQEV